MNAKNQYREFQGHFDGDGFEIFNFKITKSSSPYYFGLFGRASNGSIKNLGVTEFTITVTTLDIACVGGLVGRTESDLTNCYTSGSMTVKGKKDNERTYVNVYVGGLAKNGQPKDTRTAAQKEGLLKLLKELKKSLAKSVL